MSETVVKYTRVDRNQKKIASLVALISSDIDMWLEGRPTGKIEISLELNATQGGLGDMFIERREKGKV